MSLLIPVEIYDAQTEWNCGLMTPRTRNRMILLKKHVKNPDALMRGWNPGLCSVKANANSEHNCSKERNKNNQTLDGQLLTVMEQAGTE